MGRQRLTYWGFLPEQDEYSILNSKHFIGIHGYMLVYSVASTQSFEMVQVIRDKILNHLVRSVLTPLLVGFSLLTPRRRARSGYLLSSWETRVTCVPINVKSRRSKAKHWPRSSIVLIRKPAPGITRTSPRHLS